MLKRRQLLVTPWTKHEKYCAMQMFYSRGIIAKEDKINSKGEQRMKGKMLAFLLALTFVVSIVGGSLAEFDYSVFEDNEQFEFEVNVYDDTDTVEFPDDFCPITVSSLREDVLLNSMGIVGYPGTPTVIIIGLDVYGKHNIEEVILVPDKTSYIIKPIVKVSDTTNMEAVVIIVISKLMPMIDEIIEKQITSVKYRLKGDDDIDGELVVNVEQLNLLMDLYREADGMMQDFDIYERELPITVKSM